jgi:hypothetical protein
VSRDRSAYLAAKSGSPSLDRTDHFHLEFATMSFSTCRTLLLAFVSSIGVAACSSSGDYTSNNPSPSGEAGGGGDGSANVGSDAKADGTVTADAAADGASVGSDAKADGTVAEDAGGDVIIGADAGVEGAVSADAATDGGTAGPDASGDGSSTSDVAIPDSGPVSPGDFTVNLANTHGTVTRQIYGHNWLSPAETAWNTLGRYGGNPLSVFNWSADYYNASADYYFKGMPMAWSNYANWEDFADAGKGTGTMMLFVVPTLGWVAKGTVECVYPYSTLPNQQSYEPTVTNPDGGASLGCNTQAGAGSGCCGNGKNDAGVLLDAAVDLDAAYQRSSPSDAVAWLQSIKSALGDAGFANVIVGLDNEPDWWNTSHPDVHPQPATIAEIWSKNQTYATAIKAAFPSTPIIGPDLVEWYNTTEIQTYLTDVGSNLMSNGAPLIDYLDIHFYPSYYNFAFGCDQVPTAQRLQSPRMFWDPTYLNPYDGLPNTEAAQLIPRYTQMIANTPGATGLKLAISEYNLGTDACAAGAVAQAEAFAVFGRYGLGLAARWSDSGFQGHYQLTAGSPAESAFRMFLEHDVTGTSVDVAPKAGDAGYGPDTITAYAVLNGTTLDVLLFNKQASQATITVQLGNAAATAKAAYQFSVASTTIASVAAPAVSAGLATVTLPAQSATLVIASLP